MDNLDICFANFNFIYYLTHNIVFIYGVVEYWSFVINITIYMNFKEICLEYVRTITHSEILRKVGYSIMYW